MPSAWVKRLASRAGAAQTTRIGRILRTLRAYLGAGGLGRRASITSFAALQQFIAARSSHVAQTALYGYLRTRAGTRYPSLFEDDAFLVSINLAKWQMWLACVSDLSVFAGALVARRTAAPPAAVAALVEASLDAVLDAVGTPADAGEAFEAGARAVRARCAGCDWSTVPDDASVFTASPAALVRWAPVVEHLKALDAEIVENSVRFRWIEVRRELRRDLDAAAVFASAPAGAEP